MGPGERGKRAPGVRTYRYVHVSMQTLFVLKVEVFFLAFFSFFFFLSLFLSLFFVHLPQCISFRMYDPASSSRRSIHRACKYPFWCDYVSR